MSRGLALYYSLCQTKSNFHLYIFAFDEATFDLLRIMNLSNATVISLKEFETGALLEVKTTRTIAEYCWTCTSAVILHCLEKLHLPQICYLDADLYFWQDPQILLDEAQSASILLTEHRYTKMYDNSELSGKYCVQFMYFKNDFHGLEALKWWQAACLEWCYNRVEPGRFGDQKYLDDWLERFNHVKVLAHLGGGVAPWNVQQYDLVDENQMLLKERASGQQFLLVFYHFHGVKFINDQVDFGGYRLPPFIKNTLYRTYVKALLEVEKNLKENRLNLELMKGVNLHCQSKLSFSWRQRLQNIKNRLLGTYNLCSLAEFRTKHGTHS
ncbi:MAG: glycosyl transferase [Proteobacteria bacterium]|nr:glycosyl transferase [Pseudomonadota bacterium]